MNYLYTHQQIEPKWQETWEAHKLFLDTAKKGIKESSSREKIYLLFAFAYPSGSGLHVGHVESKTALDILARYYRMKDKDVFFPVGWDAFGLPAENYAIKTGVHPSETTKNAIDTFRRQIKRIGISYDWTNELATNHPEYYQWTQWIFLQLYKKGLAYKAPGLVNWCPSCQTVLANEQVVNGTCERCGTEVIQKKLSQWYFKITEYKDELIEGLQKVDWPKATEEQQINWIGRKTGINITYKIVNEQDKNVGEVTCFTTRPDTNFGATFVVIAPEHELVNQFLKQIPNNTIKAEIESYIEKSISKTELERQQEGRKKSGVFTGYYAVNPLTGYKMPIWIADFVLAGFGTGAVVGVPAHDSRDFEFAQAMNLRVIPVIKPSGLSYWRSYLIGAEHISDKDLKDLGIKISPSEDTQARQLEVPAESVNAYKKLIRQNLTQGFWNELVGEEIWFCFKDAQGKVTEFIYSLDNEAEIAQLCAEFSRDSLDQTHYVYKYLASNKWYTDLMIHEGDGEVINSDFLNGKKTSVAIGLMMDYLEDKGLGKRQTTYRLRDWLISRQRYWGAPIPIVYDPEGKAHAVKDEHLPWILPTDVEFKPSGESPLKYSQEFKTRVETLYGKGWTPEYDTMDTFVDSSWYFMRFTDARNPSEFASQEQLAKWLPVDFYMIGPEHIVLHLLYSRFFTKFLRDEGYLSFDEPFIKMRHQGMILGPDHRKMSKSKGNVIDPDKVVEEYGADALRIYEMFMGPIEADKPWNDRSVVGVRRFLDRVYRLVSASSQQNNTTDAQLRRKLHQTIKKVSEDIPNLKFNTAIAMMMEFVNDWEVTAKEADKKQNKQVLNAEDTGIFVQLLAPFGPFLAEELWQQLKTPSEDKFVSVHQTHWPEWDPGFAKQTQAVFIVQINGRLRDSFEVDISTSSDQDAVISLAENREKIAKWLEGKKINKVIWIPAMESKNGMINFVVS